MRVLQIPDLTRISVCMLTHEDLLNTLVYNSQTGVFLWKVRRKGKRADGVAGTKTKRGYIQIVIDGRIYLGHRLAWFYVFGRWPERDVDHRNTVKSDNAIGNLRLATLEQNASNKSRNRNNRCGLKGAHWCRHARKWIASIQADGHHQHLGTFGSAQAAHDAYVEAAIRLHRDFARVV